MRRFAGAPPKEPRQRAEGMGQNSAIEWTDTTWNPVTGCTKIARGCDNCYAERFAERFRGVPGHPFENGFDLTTRPERLRQPLAWKRPRRIFVNSMSDLFHKEIPTGFIDRVFDTMEQADWHVFQVLTKRSSPMRRYLRRRYPETAAPAHIWCGVSVEDRAATARIRHLRTAPATVRFLSIEPLLGPVGDVDLDGISWVIVGGESGPNARPMKKDWVLDIKNTCRKQRVEFFFKQWGGPTPKSGGRKIDGIEYNGRPPAQPGRENVDFRWHPDEPPPRIEEHSKAKLAVLRSYLRAYFDRLGSNLRRDELKLDLVDGFAGGGSFRDGGDIVPGTPLIMLEEFEAAKERLNEDRRKKLRLDCKFYFTEKELPHTDHLKKTLKERGYTQDDNNIVVRNGRFEDELESILAEIRRRQPLAGRSIFLLDQTGFNQVAMRLVRRIFSELQTAEVILTFAAEVLINTLHVSPAMIQAVSPLEMTESQIRSMIELRSDEVGRALAQRALRLHILARTGATYDTPFFVRPGKSRRALWLLHLSRHPVARDVMIERHWDNRNTFEHYGHGGFGMLGWEALESKKLPLFHFGGNDEQKMRDGLLNSMPKELARLVSEQPITVDAFRREIANDTTARYSDIYMTLLKLFQEKEFDILRPDGKARSRNLKHIGLADRIALPSTLLLPRLSRRR